MATSVDQTITGKKMFQNSIKMGGNKIKDLAAPTDQTDATTKKYVDDEVTKVSVDYLKKDGSVAMTGDLNAGGNKNTNVATPTDQTDATTKKYVDDEVRKVSVDLTPYLKKDDSVAMTRDLNAGGNKI